MKTIYVIRHGETSYNAAGRLQGSTDAPLNENGRELAVITGKALSDVRFDKVYSSPLDRAYETAALLLKYNRHPTPQIITDDRLREINLGSWEGKGVTKDNLEIPYRQRQLFLGDPMHLENVYGGETAADVIRRTGEFYRSITEDPDNEGKTLLVSTHGCAMRALLNSVYEDKSDFWHGKAPDNCAVNIIEYSDGESTLVGDDLIYYDPSLCANRYTLDE